MLRHFIQWRQGRVCLVQVVYSFFCRGFPLVADRSQLPHSRQKSELNVSVRTIYRDLAELASQGVRVEGKAGIGYLMKPGFFLPPLTTRPIPETDPVTRRIPWIT
jgi:hypothetical protein